ncbi:DUF4199 domain-containing protein [Winogradskyella vidalii]|uniref:DUF4199 domain-containing protein n=1 Tax=Winogradskyella vidalii TaxID=2615024 RepID=UPI0015C6E516|nr:DUF4199 domain-containing protein [Winogradskyella vidalii]
MEKKLRSSAIQFGLYIALILSGFTIVAYAINIALLTKWWINIALFIAILIIGIVSISKSKQLLEGFISFKQAFTTWFTTIVVGILISTAVNILLFNVIDPSAAEAVKQATIETSVAMMENFGAPQSEIEKAIVLMEEQNQFAVGNLLKSVAWQLLFYAVIGLIIAAIMKKNNPEFA